MRASVTHLPTFQGGAAMTSHFSQCYVKFLHNSQAYTCTLMFCIISTFLPPPPGSLVITVKKKRNVAWIDRAGDHPSSLRNTDEGWLVAC